MKSKTIIRKKVNNTFKLSFFKRNHFWEYKMDSKIKYFQIVCNNYCNESKSNQIYN
jgi:hypothetical protein